jgi:hypothetical protein
LSAARAGLAVAAAIAPANAARSTDRKLGDIGVLPCCFLLLHLSRSGEER